jgi:hypothetical protein
MTVPGGHADFAIMAVTIQIKKRAVSRLLRMLVLLPGATGPMFDERNLEERLTALEAARVLESACGFAP